MSDEDSSPKQKVDAGDRSHNVQVGRDYHHHEGPKQSLLYRPDQSDVEKFDPKFRRIREEADKVAKRTQPTQIEIQRMSPIATVLKLLLLALLIGFLITAIF